jgi:type VII secretion integral membrane protein EccD
MMTKVSFPARCAVSVVCGEHLLSQVYPASVPVEAFVDSVVELLSDDLRRRGEVGLDPNVAYELQRANGTRLDIARTLDDLGVEDGATLVLAQAVDGDSFEPQYESLSTALARIGKRLCEPVTAETAVTTALAILGIVVLATVGLALYIRADTQQSWASASVTGVMGLAIGVGALSVWRWWPDRTTLLGGLAWLVIPLATVGFASAAPGAINASHLFIAALSTAVLAVGVTALTRRQVTLAACIVTLCTIGGLVAAARMARPVPAQWLGMCVLIGLLLLVTLAPTVALWAARIRPPHFGSITGRDLFRRNDGMPVDAVAPVEEDPESDSGRDTTPRGEVIAAAARRANGVLTGICVAAAISLPAAVWATLMPGRARSNAAALLSGLFVLIFISRARVFADRRQAVPLVIGASAALCAGVARYVVHHGGNSPMALLWGALVLVGFAAAALAAALLVPVTRFTPLVRTVTEWAELIAIVAALPLAAWVGGLFTWVRMR